MTVADKIMYILQVMDWSQQVLADELNVTQATISAWLRGRAVREKYIDSINRIYNQARRIDWERKRANEAVPDGPKVLSKRGKLVLQYPYYPHQRQPWERR
ncbi:TPA: helix-turn-helix transcriptional regulator [Streptococcus suis 11538]|uniref:helix-turn-helix domain-containing protein n=1 Tax=Streptococcus suis TaxID=1307 RepID=UPI000462CB95|nr:helix-turn-helix transcriptional regulator [Streptococcus suis]HEL2310506.1 helix-turn-helix transcriptional regulator [Streptococcus suis]HEL2620148.1 helix-turn-helix transcriptional regulator [Streptococcus suis]HEL2654319.1 helix-turn-helix transcriptional regulator [Streptococcus suis]HEM2587615.1 helix-turn-helix transcriptional regulator [Streptococcus suis]HEM2715321.1 helix-turn-helix transcriptional regulator [Streptococcus suis]